MNGGDEVRLDATRDRSEAVRIEEIALLPRELVERQPVREQVAIEPPCYQPGEEPQRASFTVTVTDHAGVARTVRHRHAGAALRLRGAA